MFFTLPYPPTVNLLYAEYRGRRILSAKGKQYKNDVLAICYLNRIKPLSGDLSLTMTVYRPRKIGDLDNTQKAIFDSLKGSAFEDDKQIIEIHAYRKDDKANPRVEIEIREI
jgi:crossover junction endodeoxyribonuclease RusA